MALMHLNVYSYYLNSNTDVNIVLPDLPFEGEPEPFYRSGKTYPVLWLLHGTFGDYTDWIRKSNVERYASDKDLIVVMPSAHNSDYVNWDGFGLGYGAGDYLVRELMPLVHNWLPASPRREDNYIAGLSMGGGGAVIQALAHPEKFAGVYCMSWGAADMREAVGNASSGVPEPESVFVRRNALRNRNRLENAGGLEGYLRSAQNVWDLTAQLAEEKDLPKMYFACGGADGCMTETFRNYRKYAEGLHFPAEFFELPGYDHEWSFWDLCVRDALARFLPGEERPLFGQSPTDAG